MPSIPDRIGGQNVIRVLSNTLSSGTRLVDLSDVDASALADGYLLEYNSNTGYFISTDVLRNLRNLNVTGVTTTYRLDVIGITSFSGDLYVGGDLNVKGNINLTQIDGGVY